MERNILLLVIFMVTVLLSGCNSQDINGLSFIIEEETRKNENQLIQPTDIEELGYKPHYEVEILIDDGFSSSFNLLGERLEYLRPVDNTASFDLILDIDSPVTKNFRLMIWNNNQFLPIHVNNEQKDSQTYYDIQMPSGNHSITLSNIINLDENFEFNEIAFILLDKDAPVDINLGYSPIRMYIANTDNLSQVEIDNKDTYKEDLSLLEDSDSNNGQGIPELTILNHDKMMLNTSGITSQSRYLSIEQVNTDVIESIIFFNFDGEIYESFTTRHPVGKKAVVPIPKAIINNLGETDYYVLINNNFGKSGIKQIKNIINGDSTAYTNFSYLYKIGSID